MIRHRVFFYLALVFALLGALGKHSALVDSWVGRRLPLWAMLPHPRVLIAIAFVFLVLSLVPLGRLLGARSASVTSRRQFAKEPFPTVRRRIDQMTGRSQPDVPLIIDYIIFQAIEADASDIHLDPTREGFKVRFRIDGMMSDIADIPRHLKSKIANRLKVLSNLVVYEGFLPQDGRLSNDDGGKPRGAEFRIAFMPTLHGERIVLRILGRTGGVRPLAELGMNDEQLAVFRRHLEKPQGMIILTGPTGSGKTTTIYAALDFIKESTAEERSIATLEDPIEYEITGINQSQVDEKKEFTFQKGLRALLRQDPDVILVGEIRDPETAKIAIQAGMTGHLIITTVHANSSFATFSRLLEMGIAPFSINASITAVVTERLVRRLCEACRRERPLKPEEIRQLGLQDKEADFSVFDADGCSHCQGRGFKGRYALFEILEVTEPIRELVSSGASADAIFQKAKAEGMQTLFKSGLEAVRLGHTSPEEMLRVVMSDR
jgi:type II secretory ATPase GspE/PulE/Tfp pilus assembly ATPase PilB-like protein